MVDPKTHVLTEKKAALCRPRARRQGADPKNPQESVEILVEGQECPFCHFAKLRREGQEIACPVCGCGRRACT